MLFLKNNLLFYLVINDYFINQTSDNLNNQIGIEFFFTKRPCNKAKGSSIPFMLLERKVGK